jgi:hypothetical protein
MPDRPQKITFAEVREMGVRGLLVYCADFRCSHSIAISADDWPDDVRPSDIEARFVCNSSGMIQDATQLGIGRASVYRALGRIAASVPIEIRPHVGTALAAGLAAPRHLKIEARPPILPPHHNIIPLSQHR